MTPSSFKDQLVALGVSVTCDDVRNQGSLSALHTSATDCAVTVEASFPRCALGGVFGQTGDFLIGEFYVTYRNAFACPPFPTGGNIANQISSNYQILNISEVTTQGELLSGIRRYYVALNLVQFPICSAVGLTAINSCGNVGYGKMNPDCTFRLCYNCIAQNWNVPPLAFSQTKTWTNPVAYVGPIGFAPYIAGNEITQTISAPTNVTQIQKQYFCSSTHVISPIRYKCGFSQTAKWSGKYWHSSFAGVVNVDWEYTITGELDVVIGTNGSAGNAGGAISIHVPYNVNHFVKEWGFGYGGFPYSFRTRSWTGCYTSTAAGQGGNCAVISNGPNGNFFQTCVTGPPNTGQVCAPDNTTPQTTTASVYWRGIGWTVSNPTPGWPLPPKGAAGTITPPTLSIPCGTVSAKIISC